MKGDGGEVNGGIIVLQLCIGDYIIDDSRGHLTRLASSRASCYVYSICVCAPSFHGWMPPSLRGEMERSVLF